LDCEGSTRGLHLLRGILQWVTLWGKVLVCPRGWRGIFSCNHQTYVWIFCYHIHVDGSVILLVGWLALRMHRT
jgi:hypothetical protein